MHRYLPVAVVVPLAARCRSSSYTIAWRPDSIDVNHQNGAPVFNVVFRPGTRGERFYSRWPVAAFRTEYDQRSAEGWRIQSIDVEDGVVFAVLRPGTEQERLLLNLNADDYQNQVTALYPASWRTRIIDSSQQQYLSRRATSLPAFNHDLTI